MKKKILIDCGSNLGQGYEQIKKNENIDSSWDVVMFEPSFSCFEKLINKYNNSNFKIYNKAVYISDQKQEFHFVKSLSTGDIDYESVGCKLGAVKNLFSDRKKIYDLSEPVLVDTIDLSSFILDLNYETIILKLDVEGSEYDILQRMIETGSINKLHKIYVEFHNYAIDLDKRDKYNDIKIEILKYLDTNNIKFVEWH